MFFVLVLRFDVGKYPGSRPRPTPSTRLRPRASPRPRLRPGTSSRPRSRTRIRTNKRRTKN